MITQMKMKFHAFKITKTTAALFIPNCVKYLALVWITCVFQFSPQPFNIIEIKRMKEYVTSTKTV